MTNRPEYRFAFQIVDATTGQVIESDYTTITNARIDEFGGCETVDHEVARMLRNWKRFAREEYERGNADDTDADENLILNSLSALALVSGAA